MADFRLETARLVLRSWRADDLADLHALCSDPRVMATIGPLLDEGQTAAMLARLQERERRDGCTYWAMEHGDTGRVIGFCGVGLGTVAPVAGQLEIGWWLAADWWGQSLAREAAEASLAWAGSERPGETIWAITAHGNTRSRSLMERLGMRYCEGLDFDHPALAPDSPLLPYVTYRLDMSQ